MFKNHKAFKIVGLIVVVIVILFFAIGMHGNSLSKADQAATSPANNAATTYQNNLTLNWVKANWTEINDIPTLNFPRIPQNDNIYAAENITYCTAGDQKLTLDLYSDKQPSAGSLKPIVVYVHGGGMIGGDKRNLDGDVSPVLLGLVNDGFIVASINYQIAPQYKYPSQIQDVLCAMRFLRYYAYGIGGDQNKIGIFGDSVGGQLAALAGTTNGLASWENSDSLQLAGANLTREQYLKIPSRPNAVVDYYGGTELPPKILVYLMKLFHVPSYHDPLSNKTYTMADLYQEIYNSNATLMHEASPINYVTSNGPPFLIVQGDKDTLNEEKLSVDFYNKLKSAGNNATLIIVKNADHRFLPNPSGSKISPSLVDIVSTTVNFFKSCLG